MMGTKTWWCAAATAVLLAACVGAPPKGDLQRGFSVWGYLGRGPTAPAAMVPVTLFDARSGRPVASAQTDMFGKYGFSGLPPGSYAVRAEKVTREVTVVDRDLRLDIDLNAPGGVMNYAAAAPAAGGAAPAGPNDPRLARQIAGVWWGYAGSTERRIGLCPGGVYREFTESGYSGTSTDQYGNQTMAWGSASQGGGAGSWTVTGNADGGTIHVSYANGDTATIRFRRINDPGCLSFEGSTLCRKSTTCR